MATPTSLTWNVDGQCTVWPNPEWGDVQPLIELLKVVDGTIALVVLGDDSAVAETLQVQAGGHMQADRGRYLVTLLESYTDTNVTGTFSAGIEPSEQLVSTWMVQTIDVVTEMFNEFFTTGGLPMDLFY